MWPKLGKSWLFLNCSSTVTGTDLSVSSLAGGGLCGTGSGVLNGLSWTRFFVTGTAVSDAGVVVAHSAHAGGLEPIMVWIRPKNKTLGV